jgi:hypothetical protein
VTEVVCARCDGEGYLCILCELAPTACECCDEVDESANGEADLDIEVKRCSCNPRPKKTKVAP